MTCRERGSVLVMVLVTGLFLSALGLSLLSLTGALMLQVHTQGAAARARALAQGAETFGLRGVRDGDQVARSGTVARGSVHYADGTQGRYVVEYDLDLKLIRSTGRVGDARSVFVSRFERY